MIERKFITEQIKYKQVQEYIEKKLGSGAGYSCTEIKRTPLGEKIIVYSNKPGLVVGKKGANIKELTDTLKDKFKMENPQIEVADVSTPTLDPGYMARKLVDALEKFGPKRFKFLGYRALEEIMAAGAIGAEIVIAGRGVPSTRAKSWRFSTGLLIKCGDASETEVKKCYTSANLRSGTIGVKVSILPPSTKFSDRIAIKESPIMPTQVQANVQHPKEVGLSKLSLMKKEKNKLKSEANKAKKIEQPAKTNLLKDKKEIKGGLKLLKGDISKEQKDNGEKRKTIGELTL